MYGRRSFIYTHLDVGRVEHDTDSGAESVRRKVLLELGTDDTVVTVGTGDLAPHNTDLRTVDLLAGLVNISDSLTKVKLSVLSAGNTSSLMREVLG